MSARPLPRIQAQDETIEMYRRVQFYKPPLKINSSDEARAILAEDDPTLQLTDIWDGEV